MKRAFYDIRLVIDRQNDAAETHLSRVSTATVAAPRDRATSRAWSTSAVAMPRRRA
jgi:hypothetical protein